MVETEITIEEQMKALRSYEALEISTYKRNKEEILEEYLRKKNQFRELEDKKRLLLKEMQDMRKEWKFLQEYEGKLGVEAKKAANVDNRPKDAKLRRFEKRNKKKAEKVEKSKKNEGMETDEKPQGKKRKGVGLALPPPKRDMNKMKEMEKKGRIDWSKLYGVDSGMLGGSF